ncbi:S8 family peptidase [Zobellella denitrificans]|uniref:S8 family peptidase n=1 Tax=Zobellella denitrificans TaxID=347534 RepID=UPI000BBE6C0E|nr:S8 family serine peptidase [Zobellella denitrificans]
MSYIRNILLGMAGLLLAGAVSAQPAQGLMRADFEPCPDPGQAIESLATPCMALVQFGEAQAPGRGAQLLRGAGAVVRFDFPALNGAAVLVPNERVYWALVNDQRIARLLPDRRLGIAAPPNRCSPWPSCKNDDGGAQPPEPGTSNPIPAGVQRIGADQVWNRTTGPSATGLGVTVWVVDTGVDGSHADLQPDSGTGIGGYIGGVSCLGTASTASCVTDGGIDDNGHGTHVAGIVGARHNDIDVVGVAPDSAIASVKVLDSTGNGYDSNLIAGLEYIASQAATGGLHVVNMSLARPGNCQLGEEDSGAALISDSLTLLNQWGVVVVAAAGNDPNKEISDLVPAGCPQVMAVASTTAMDGTNKCRALRGSILADTASYFTTDGAGVLVSAPGSTREDNTCGGIQPKGILSLAVGGGTTEKNGTSMAAPHVAGLAALMLQADAALPPDGVRTLIGCHATRRGQAPLSHPFISQSFDGEREGIAWAPATVGAQPCN